MLNPSDIAALLLRAQALQAQQSRANAVQEYTGNLHVNWRKITQFSLLIQTLGNCLFTQDYSSDSAIAVFGNLTRCVGSNFASGVSTDPEAQPPGGNVIIIDNGGSGGSNVQLSKIPFVTVTGDLFIITNYQGLYAAIYGNNPFLDVYIVNPVTGIGYIEDTSTVPQITYVGGIEANGIDTITLDYAISTTGYLQILGITSST